jgi:CubicO group peptidase (beta-lactamase class C family)
MIDKVATIPLLSQPGQAWRYSVAVDVQGYIVEKLSGQPLDVFMQERIFRPLKMTDTAFYVAPAKVGRLAAVYGVNPQTGALIDVPASFAQDYTKPPAMISGGGGLVSTTSDYARFCQMILNDGVLDGARILSPASIDLLGANHLPQGQGLNADGRGGTQFAPGMGFGLGFSVVDDPARAGSLAGKGTLAWGGAAGTWFWIDRENDLFFIGMIQRMGGSSSLGAADLSRVLVYQALTDPAR